MPTLRGGTNRESVDNQSKELSLLSGSGNVTALALTLFLKLRVIPSQIALQRATNVPGLFYINYTRHRSSIFIAEKVAGV